MGDDLRYQRVLLKVSGEAFSQGGDSAIEESGVATLADEIAAAHALGVEIAVVNGGGNILRGGQTRITGLSRATADHMGMLATVINALALQDVLESRGIETRLLTALEIRPVAEPYIRRRCVRHLERGRVVILAAGTGHPFFTTDTTAALRGIEIGAQVLLKGTKVDGVYDKDPKVHPDAQRFDRISFEEVYRRKLEVMDRTAITMCIENDLPIVVFDMTGRGNLAGVLRGADIGTIVGADEETAHGR